MTQEEKTKDLIELKDLLYIWKLFKKNWYLFILLPLIAGTLAYLKVYPLQDIYGAKTSIELSTSEMDPQASYYSSWGMTKDYSNEVRVLNSRKLVAIALEKMDIGVAQFLVGRLKTTDQYPFHFFDIEANISNYKYQNLPFNIEVLNANDFELSYTLNEVEYKEKYNFKQTIYKNGLILKIDRLKDPVEVIGLKHQFIIQGKNTLINKYLSSLSIVNDEGSSVADVQVNDVVGIRAVSFLDTLGMVYIENSLESKYKVNAKTVEYINVQLNQILEVLNNIESDIERYRETKKILNLTKEEELFFNRLIELKDQIALNKTELNNLLELQNYLASDSKMDILPPNVFIDYKDKFLTETFNRLYSLQTKQREILGEQKNNSFYVSLNENEIQSLKKNLLKYLISKKKAIGEELKVINNKIIKIENKIKEMPKAVRQLNNINRNLEVNEQIYLYLLQKKAETNIAKAGIISDKKIIEPAYLLGIIGPNRKKTYVTYIGAALGLAALISVIRLVAFDTIDTVEDLKNVTTLPVVGEIAKDYDYTQELGIAIEKFPKSHLSETFRSVRTNLEYMAGDEKNKVILLTSFSSGEGKTFCSINLATILARAEKRVLLIGLDLHKPQFASYLDYDQNLGITSYLVGKAELNEVILNHNDYLDIIPSGPVPPNASELLYSYKLESLLEKFKTEYDYIVIDSPPIGALSDAKGLMKYSNINLFVLRSNVAKKYFVKQAEELYKSSKPKNFAFLVNDVNFKKENYNYYSYTDYVSGES